MVRCANLFVTLCLLLFSSCATNPLPAPAPSTAEPPAVEEQTDLACAYFYFLWGTQAEYQEQYPEALEAYEKSLICDPDAGYVKEKIPVLLLKMGDFVTAREWLTQAIIEQPDNNTYRLLLANLYIQQEEIEKAILLYNEVLAREKDNEGVSLRLALLYSHMGKYATAEKIFKQLQANNVDSYFTHLSYARLLKQMGRYVDAAREYEKALTLNWSKDLAYEIGYLYVTQRMFTDALRTYTSITDEDQFDERAALSRIQALVDLERTDEALNELYSIRLYSKDTANIDLIISKLLLRQEKTAQAKEILTRLLKDSESSEARYILALLAYQEEDFATSLKHLAYIRSASDELEEAVYLQTRIHQKLGDIDEAITLLKQYTSDENSRSPLFYALLSSLYQAKDEQYTAMTVMETAVSIYPDNHQLLFEYGLVLEKNGKPDEALRIMQRVLELQPDNAEALNYIGYTWADQNINLAKALEYILRANALKPDNGFIIDSLGWVYYRLGDFEQAATLLERSLQLIPNDPHVYHHLGDVYRSLKNFPQAIKAYKKALEMFQDEEQKTTVKQKIHALENQ